MSQRFFVDTPIRGDAAELTGAEAQHLVKVMRGQIGDEVVLFDGSGDEFTGRIARLERGRLLLTGVIRRRIDRELPFTLELAVALPKGDRQRWLVEKLTEMGVTGLVPLVTARGIVQPDAGTLVRLKRFVIESSKQCGRNRLMEIALPRPWHEYVAAGPTSTLRVLAHPSVAVMLDPSAMQDCLNVQTELSSSPVASRAVMPARGGRAVAVAIGPEGGLTIDEVAQAVDAGWHMVTLGPRILRVETAAVALAAMFAVQ